ncbi:MAG TPA: RNA polymerase factor sigma-54 [Bdellovibrionota bacterium]|nr:RNA polymerase factor sigma-54 [Bdellovibrionota bacterium]
MALELKQSLRLSQQLVMTPQLQQAIKLLQLNRLELAEHVMGELLENPILEEYAENADEEDVKETKQDKIEKVEDAKTKEVDPQKGEGSDDINWENYLNSQPYTPSYGGAARDIDPDLPSFEATLTRADSLAEHLMSQLHLTRMSDHEMNIGAVVIGNLDDNGYLVSSLEDMARKTRTTPEEVEKVLKKIQEFDPIGVGARDLRECLLIQAKQIPHNDLIRKIIENHLHDLERKAYPAISKACGVPPDQVIAAVKEITKLEPKPGRPFYDESSQYITPDIYVYKVGDEYVIVQNEDGLPKLRISNFYQSVLRGNHSSSMTKEYINDKLRSAVWLIRSIHQRQRTIYKVTESIVKIQRDFLERGISALKPMVLRDVAEDIGMHESTVSRVTANKYIHTPQGVYELKFFFNSSIKRVEGADVASEVVKEKIKTIVVAEDPRRPYSDQELVELLRQLNIDIARRTVAKYREMLGILSSSKRKRLF